MGQERTGSTTWSTAPQVALLFDGDRTGGDIMVFTPLGPCADDIPPPDAQRAHGAGHPGGHEAAADRKLAISSSLAGSKDVGGAGTSELS